MKWFTGIVLLLSTALAAGAETPIADAGSIYRLKAELAGEIQAKILDPVLGAGKSHVFADFEPEVRREHEIDDHHGTGLATKLGPAPGGTDLLGLKITPAVKKQSKEARAAVVESTLEQKAEQVRGISEQRLKLNLRLTDLRVLVIHDAEVSQDRIAAAKRLILAAYGADLIPAHLTFRPAVFARR